MAKFSANTTLKRLRNRYRLLVMNDDTFEEVVTFRLSRLSVYIMMSSIFVLLIGLTVALLVLTPLRYYIPGYGKTESRSELQMLQIRTDSLEQVMEYKEKYLNDLQTVLNGNTPVKKDTTTIKVDKAEQSSD